ncbi:hypothetical protein ASD08_47880 [Streptomyces sp. Root369]|nr:hypothetical protein ASD08_47880 [Streptomyces sp. Root369]
MTTLPASGYDVRFIVDGTLDESVERVTGDYERRRAWYDVRVCSVCSRISSVARCSSRSAIAAISSRCSIQDCCPRWRAIGV